MWDPERYLDYAEERARPFRELIARVDISAPRRVVDLGCGPGNLTLELARRWPSAALEAMDSSPEMVNAAKSRGIDARQGDVRDWVPRPGADVVVCNACLHWIPEHRALLRRWVGSLERGAVIAVQVPGNFDAPSHVLARELTQEPTWASRLSGVLPAGRVVDDAAGYAGMMSVAGCLVDAWETVYVQRMDGADGVLDWLSGTALVPVKRVLGERDWQSFRSELLPRLAMAYPRSPDGVVWFPFRRVFFVARVR